MDFCYLHPSIEANGICSSCGNFICKNDYRILNDEISRKQEWINTKYYDSTMNSYQYGQRRMTNIEMGPVIFCAVCYDRILGIKPENDQSIVPERTYHKKRVLMCTQCGEKLAEEDKFCPSCGDPTDDEQFDGENPIGGVRSSKKLK